MKVFANETKVIEAYFLALDVKSLFHFFQNAKTASHLVKLKSNLAAKSVSNYFFKNKF